MESPKVNGIPNGDESPDSGAMVTAKCVSGLAPDAMIVENGKGKSVDNFTNGFGGESSDDSKDANEKDQTEDAVSKSDSKEDEKDVAKEGKNLMLRLHSKD